MKLPPKPCHLTWMALFIALRISGDLKPTWRMFIIVLLFDVLRFAYHQIKYKIYPENTTMQEIPSLRTFLKHMEERIKE